MTALHPPTTIWSVFRSSAASLRANPASPHAQGIAMAYLPGPARRLLLAVALSFAPGVALAQTVCFQPVGSVPPVYGQPPQWWAAGAPLGSSTDRKSVV